MKIKAKLPTEGLDPKPETPLQAALAGLSLVLTIAAIWLLLLLLSGCSATQATSQPLSHGQIQARDYSAIQRQALAAEIERQKYEPACRWYPRERAMVCDK